MCADRPSRPQPIVRVKLVILRVRPCAHHRTHLRAVTLMVVRILTLTRVPSQACRCYS